MLSVITYFTGGILFAVPNELWFSYVLSTLRFIFAGYVLSYYFNVEYTVITMALSVLLADFRFYTDFSEYMLNDLDDEEDNDDGDDDFA